MNWEFFGLLKKALSLLPKALAGSLLTARAVPCAESHRQEPSRLQSWSEYLADGPVASPAFMDDVEDLPAGGRKLQR
jgi:hypothetical protein